MCGSDKTRNPILHSIRMRHKRRADKLVGRVPWNKGRLAGQKRILKKHGYPPDLQEEATKTVLAQAELLSAIWAVA